MNVQAKFYVTSILHHHTQNQNEVCAEIKLAPVYGDENKPWSKYTPQGEIKMTVTNPAAIEAFELGKPYLLTFEPAPVAASPGA